MAASNLPARLPDRRPENNSAPRPTWPRAEKKPTRFAIKVGGMIPC